MAALIDPGFDEPNDWREDDAVSMADAAKRWADAVAAVEAFAVDLDKSACQHPESARELHITMPGTFASGGGPGSRWWTCQRCHAVVGPPEGGQQ